MFEHSSSFRRSNSSFAADSWLNTLTTFWPFTISSTKPFRLAREVCCFMKKFALRLPSLAVALIMNTVPTMVTSVSHTLHCSMLINTTIRVMRLETVWGSTWLTIWRSVSVSLV